jgi:hypothetical protein
MTVVCLGATGRRPAVEVLTAPGGERLPLPLPGDDGAFDHAVPRSGWIAVQTGDRVQGLVDDDWLRPTALRRS